MSAGHINFNDEVTAGLRLSDGVLLCVDAVEGVMLVTEKVLKQAAAEGLPICLLLTKVRHQKGLCTMIMTVHHGQLLEGSLERW